MGKIFVLLCMICTAVVSAQTGNKITGKVFDATTRKGIEYATITVADRASHKVINGAISDSTGAFAVSGLSQGVYTATIEFIGYTKKVVDSIVAGNGRSNISIGTIYLEATGHMLKDVTITASAPIIENKIDKIVYNAANDITSQGGQALDVLKKVPQVNVDIDGNVELQGNANIRFLINGKPSSVFGTSVTDALAAIPASQIKSIEVITSPGAKYDAQGTGGIINIILKESRIQGFNGSINLSGGTRLENGSINLNYRHNTWGLNAYVSGNAQLVSRTPSIQDRSSYDSAAHDLNHLRQDGYSDFRRNGYQSGLGFDWSITKHDNITASVSTNHFGYTNKGLTQVWQDTAGSTAPPIRSQRYSNNFSGNNNVDFNLNYKKTFFKEGQEFDLAYTSSYAMPQNNFQQTSTYASTTIPYSGSASDNPGTNREHYISADYSHPISEKISIETGAKASLLNITSTTEAQLFDPTANEYVPNARLSYHLNYDLRVYAAYLSASFPVTSFINAKAGMRYEYTDTRIDFPHTIIPAYGTWVPSMTLSHDLDKNQFIKLSYSRRIDRPNYRDVNPFLNFSDPYNVSTGNPTLLPEIGNNMELGYNLSFGKGTNIYAAFIERINTQDHKQVTTFYPLYRTADTAYTGISVTNPQNIGTEYNTGINVSYSWTIKDKLSLRGNTFFSHRHAVGLPPGSNGSDGNRFRTNLNLSYQLPNDLIVEVFGNYNAPSNNIQGRSPQSISYTMAFRKQFWKKNASIGVTATNLFNKYTRQVTTVVARDYTSYVERQLPYRSIGISFTYKFGKLEFKKGKEDESYMNNPPAMGG